MQRLRLFMISFFERKIKKANLRRMAYAYKWAERECPWKDGQEFMFDGKPALVTGTSYLMSPYYAPQSIFEAPKITWNLHAKYLDENGQVDMKRSITIPEDAFNQFRGTGKIRRCGDFVVGTQGSAYATTK